MALLKLPMKGPNEIVPFDHPFIEYPQLASTKFDGFRLISLCGEQLLSPKLKPFANLDLPNHFPRFLEHCRKNRLVTDGELWSPCLPFNELSSIVRSHHGYIPPEVAYYVFDIMTEEEWDNGTEKDYMSRYLNYSQTLVGFSNIVPVEQCRVTSAEEAEEFFNKNLDAGQEGIVMRQLNAKYKHGRCTLKQDGMWKFKEFQTHDAVIIGVEEQMKLKQGVRRTLDSLGHLERRYEQDLYEPAGMIGAFVCIHKPEKGDMFSETFKVKPGKGMNNEEKIRIWKDVLAGGVVGRHCEFKYMPHGTKDKPRIGSLVRFRPDLD